MEEMHFRRRPIRLKAELLEPRIVLAAQPLITEFMARNNGLFRDGDGRSGDWVEIYNAGDEEANLQGYHLTDDPTNLTKWAFPSKVLQPDEYVVVFATDRDEADYVDPDGFLHATFALNAGGEYIALVAPGEMIVSQYGTGDTEYPGQQTNVSFGIAYPIPNGGDVRVGYLGTATPGFANVTSDQVFDGFVENIQSSTLRGFYDAPFSLELSTVTPDATIRYTTDGSQPTLINGSTYESAISISSTTPFRAVAFKEDLLPTPITTQTFVFLDDVVGQTGDGLPQTWGVFPFGSSEAAQGSPVPANYNMDPEVVNDPRYKDTIVDDLQSLPTVSISMNPDDLWDEETGVYSNTMEKGSEWERVASIELFNPENASSFQIDAGIRLHGGFGRRPSGTAKHSFRLLFKGEYGNSKLAYPWFGTDQVSTFDTIVLRANYNYSWARGNRGGAQTGKDYTIVTDRWAANTQQEMGGLAPNGVFVHLYINGLYWGIYNPTERPDASFLAEHLGGRESEYDVVAHDGLVDGTMDAWNELLDRARARDYDAVKQILDVDNYIDYMILNQYGGNFDWPQNNWYASRPRDEDGKWQFHSWDAEFFFVDEDANRISTIDGSGPGAVFVRLRRDPEFQIDFADRIYKHLFNEGALTPENNIERLNDLASIVDRAVVGESARWGDAWMNQVAPARTRDDDWLPRIAELNEKYFPVRGELVLSQYRRVGLFPDTLPPELSQFGGTIEDDFELGITNPNGAGVVFYTLDGSDPRLPGGEVNPSAIELQGEAIRLSGSPQLMTRVLNGEEWSAVADVQFQLTGDLDGNGLLEPADIDFFCQAANSTYNPAFDFDMNGNLDNSDLLILVQDQLNSSIGDANLDGLFNSSDFVKIFQAAKFETNDAASWESGDWNCDFQFSSSDFVWAFVHGDYVQAAHAVPPRIDTIKSVDTAFAFVVPWIDRAADSYPLHRSRSLSKDVGNVVQLRDKAMVVEHIQSADVQPLSYIQGRDSAASESERPTFDRVIDASIDDISFM